MRYLEIRPGVNLKKEDCICVENVDEMSCKIWTSIGSYDCSYPSWRILMLLEQEDIEENFSVVQQGSPVDRTNLFGAQHWVG